MIDWLVWVKKKKKKNRKNLWFQLLKCEYFLISSLLYDSKLNIFELWTKQDIWGRHLVLWETLIDIFWHFIDQTTKRLIKKVKFNSCWSFDQFLVALKRFNCEDFLPSCWSMIYYFNNKQQFGKFISMYLFVTFCFTKLGMQYLSQAWCFLTHNRMIPVTSTQWGIQLIN